MKHSIFVLALLTLSLMGCRELSEPKNGYIIVPHILSPVTIRTKDLEGVGWIQAYTTAKQWEPIFLSPEGSFVYEDVLPTNVWHCTGSGQLGDESCVALLQAGDEKGALGAAGRPGGKFAVCTESYKQTMGRKHCGERALQDLFSTSASVELPRTRTQIHSEWSDTFTGQLDFMTYRWIGDPWSRAFAGSQSFPEADTWHPPPDDRYSEPTSTWVERRYTPGESPGLSGEFIASVDIGACSIFIPWEWENRIRTDAYTTVIGLQTGNRGLAEVMLDGVIEGAEPTESIMRDAFLYMDSVTNVVPRTDVSPEFHVRMGNNTWGNPTGKTEVQLCLKNYFRADNNISEGVDAWYRWDQGILSALTSLFGIGDCRATPVSVFYCGAIDIDPATRKGRFRIATDIHVNVEGYSVFKPACNNQFVPLLKDGLKDGIRTTGALNLSDGINDLVENLQSVLAVEIRRLEPTPTGLYVITANTLEDPQYGVGNCLPDLEKQNVSTHVQPSITQSYPATGITRF